MIDEFMLWELTMIAMLTGMLIGIVGTLLAMKVIARINALEEKANKYDAIEKNLAEQTMPHTTEEKK
jgi:uncharacterized membrane-anchored protein YhcB (DUF1043 family)